MIVLDGGMSRELIALGAPFEQPEWSALSLIEAPHFVRQVHDRFVAAGADVITTNAYALVPFHLGEERFRRDGRRLADLAGRLTREAADAAGHKVRVAASVPPLFGSYEPDKFDPAGARELWPDVIDPQAPHADLFLAETISCIDESLTALELCAKHGKPVWLSCTLDDAVPVLRSGETIGDWLTQVNAHPKAAAVEAVLFNCSQPEVMEAAVRHAAGLAGNRDIGVYANAFIQKTDETAANEGISDIRRELTPDLYADFARAWKAAGAGIIGGCCGIGAEHIARLKAVL